MAFGEGQHNCDQITEIYFGREENIVGKGENAGYQYFLLFPQCFQKASFTQLLKVVIVLYFLYFVFFRKCLLLCHTQVMKCNNVNQI